MAKKEAQVQENGGEAAPATPATETKAATGVGGAAIVLPSGERRIDYIRRRFKEGAKRGEIAKELGVKYQIVFAATKELKEAPAAEASVEISAGGSQAAAG